jgi:hypothetical protein
MTGPAPIRQQLEAAIAAQPGSGGGGAPAAPAPAAQDDQPGKGPVTRDAFSYQDNADPAIQCGGCEFYEDGEHGCELYDELNRAFPNVFNLDASTTPQAGCKAHVDAQGASDDQADQDGAGQDSY